MEHPFTNSLINETSPYLLQHAHNPVNWLPWSSEALQLAKAQNKIILVSIGYSACHWCHVMERESFEDESTAAIMNEHFINIKIDREERPDIDHIYMDAVQAMTGSGGWPLNVFLTPEAKPFYGGTYFPPVNAFNRSSWKETLAGVITAWKDRSHEVISQAENLTAYLQQTAHVGMQKNTVVDIHTEQIFTSDQCHDIFKAIMKTADKEWGGFGKAPKFPQTFTIQYLLRYHYYTNSEEALKQAMLSVDKLLQGGIYDHIGGGLARYSTDIEWLAPHFEKMLYDNALLITTLSDLYKLTRKPAYKDAISKTINFVRQELLNDEGGFYSALDADTEGEEGKYYVWSKKEIEEVLQEDADLFCEFFDITEQGNWEEKNILRILIPQDEFITNKNLDKDGFERFLSASLSKLKQVRDKRSKPLLDDKSLLSWNSLMIIALCNAAEALQDDTYKLMAEKAFNFIMLKFNKAQDSYEMYHTYKHGIAKYPAFLDDYAYFIAACIKMYKTTFNNSFIQTAKKSCIYVLDCFAETGSPYLFFTHKTQTDVIVRKKEIYDGAVPSGNGIMANNLLELGIIFDKIEWRQKANDMLINLLPTIIKYPGSFGIWTMFLINQVAGINEIVVVGEDYKTTGAAISVHFIPNSVMMCSEKGNDEYPMLKNKGEIRKNLIYLCQNFECKAPFSKTGTLIAALSRTI